MKFLNDFNFNESIWCEIYSGRDKLLLGCVYRPPSSGQVNNSRLVDLIRLVDGYIGDGKMLICGDFNYGAISWSSNNVDTQGQHTVAARCFLDVINDCYMIQNVTDFTHNREEENSTLLDLVLTKNELEIENFSHISPVGASHHDVLAFEFVNEIDMVENSTVLKYKYSRGDYRQAEDLLRNVHWEEVFSGKSLDEKYNVFFEVCNGIVDRCVPKFVTSPRVDRSKWLTHSARVAIEKKSRAWRRLKSRKTRARRLQYKRARNRATTLTRRARMNYEKRVAEDSKTNPKHFWSWVRSRNSVKENVMCVNRPDGLMTECDAETAEVLNSTFVKAFNIENGESPAVEEIFHGDRLDYVNVGERDILRLLSELNVHKSSGPDNLSPWFLKECRNGLVKPLTLLLRESMVTGVLPDVWKKAFVTPIFKKGSKLDPVNYRPVSLTCISCKMLETLIRDELVRHLEDNQLLSDVQHGFRRGRSCLTNLLTYLDEVGEAVDRGPPVDVNFMDCEKAFDKVPHKRLLTKLEAMGVTGGLLRWIEEFLNQRKQSVVVRGEKSTWRSVTSGVPQGSVLGPVLFLVYINDLVRDLECPSSLFADDAKVYRALKNVDDIDAMRRDMKRLEEWSRKWLLSFNVSKCSTMHFGASNPRAVYQLNGQDLRSTAVERDLGVLVSEDLKSTPQVHKVSASANRVLGLIRRNFLYLDSDIVRSLYCSLVRPILDYGSQSWAPYLQGDINELEKVQKRALSLIPGMDGLSYEEKCRRAGLQSLEKRRLRGDMIEVYKILHGFEDVDPTKFFTLSNRRSRGHRWKLERPDHWRTTMRGNCFSIRVIEPWNNLEEEIVNAPSIKRFKELYDRRNIQFN